MPFQHVCKYCNIDFISIKRTAKYCSQSCCGKHHADGITSRNKARRKYPEAEGLNRNQVYYRQTNGKDALRDVEKRHRLINYLGGKCVECGYDKDVRGMVLDHIHGNGAQDRKEKGSKVFRYYANHLDEAKQVLQVLCATCNQIKAIEKREHNKTRRVIDRKAA